MSTSRRKLLLNSVSVNLGCGTCRKPKLDLIFHPKPKPKNSTTYPIRKLHHHHSFSDHDSATSTTTTTNTTFSPCSYVEFGDYEKSSSSSNTIKGPGKVGRRRSESGVAVEKDSDDPYLDFRRSMLQMILENEIYSKDGLRELLNCFLQLNSPQHHGVIVRAFTDIWNGVFSVRSGPVHRG
ncbi:transcription repressor OFP6-like [Lotus japonicus]|uniref:transcription repressor OFP6-like n=1 Tax=Lotus japonicus TaxID=34305 RepID=UPI0025837BAA|nr:transcription repressor OFP6-like [Lotus japonicus]